MVPLWEIVWVLAVLVTGIVMFGAWTGPHRVISNLSRWAMWMRITRVPAWLSARSADRFAFRGGLLLLLLLLLLAIAWFVPSPPEHLESPATVPDSTTAPPRPQDRSRPDRHIDVDLQNAIRVHVPKAKRVRMVVLKDDPEADQFAWEIDAFLRGEGYTVVAPRLFFAMAEGGATPIGTAIYPDEKDTNIINIRIGLNDRR